MTKSSVMILAAIGLVVACLLMTIWTGSRGCNHCLDLFVEHATANDMEKTVSALMLLRQGRSDDAVNILEGQLDGLVSTFGNYVKERPQSSWHTNVTRALKDTKAYRLANPHVVSAPILKVPVDEILERVEAEPDHQIPAPH